MTYDVLATDYDGTLAHHGKVDAATLAALERAKAGGIRLLMVTGRELSDLMNTFDRVALFDRVVAENGALLFDPATEQVETLAPAPPPELVARLQAASVPLSVGHSIVATVEPHEHVALAAIRELGLEWHVIFNKGAVMILPSEVTKATGLVRALEEIGATAERTVGIGDAENDQAFFRACGLSVAVANALPAVKETADLVTSASHGGGVAELVEWLLSGALDGRRRGGANDEANRPG